MHSKLSLHRPLLAPLIAWTMALPCVARAQLVPQPIPFSIEFSPSTLLAERNIASLPLWMESVKVTRSANRLFTTVRLRLRPLPSLVQSVELRVTLAPSPVGKATVTAWNEAGKQCFEGPAFGSAEATVTEIIRIPAAGADYIDVVLPRDGSRLSGLFATALRSSPVLHPIDFPPAPVQETFTSAPLSANDPEKDRLLLGRVSALLDPGPFTLEEEKPTALEFSVPKKPTAALLTFEVRNVWTDFPPVLSINGTELAIPMLQLPDLADPAWQFKKNRVFAQGALHYSGWIRVQQMLPPELLISGNNRLSLLQSRDLGCAEVRNIEIQLKNFR
ncbi:MAG: hypothetical protein RLZZ399_727 [Verrucomicrobiota bacterium]